ncbi:hypothetical protein AAG747_06785 [Rapidithrix thailandica]|uniref:NIPSNAP domain-containing protein n=1 Tax=Rapidithrix thailandica TaxID=413964 RepID=A0AAW9RS63_9BACT
MKTTFIFLLLCIFNFHLNYAQESVFSFFEYKLKEGMREQFINGYEKDLEWHQSQKDDWAWVGWFVINGERRGRFIDATPDHQWSDFDRWKVNGAENARHNNIHWTPYVEKPSGSYKSLLKEYSHYQQDWYKKPYLQVYHLEIKHGQGATFRTFLRDYKAQLQTQLKEVSFIWMKTVSGGTTHAYQLFVSLNKLEELRWCENLFGFSETTTKLAQEYSQSVKSNTSELWKYSARLSAYPEAN